MIFYIGYIYVIPPSFCYCLFKLGRKKEACLWYKEFLNMLRDNLPLSC